MAPDAHLTSIGQTAVAASPEAPADDSGAPPLSGVRRTRLRSPALDGLRAIAIAAVVWHHSLPWARPGLLGRGYLGVPLFFALSGFLITRLLLAERQATGDISLRRFWLRRCLRIVPLYYVVLAGFVVRVALLEPDDATRHFFSSLPAYASYTSNWFVAFDVPHPVWFGFAWSLATEEQFYLWWPPLLRLAARAGRWLSPLVLVSLLGLDQLAEHGALAAWLPSGTVSARVATSCSGAMGLGALFALLLQHPRGYALLGRVLAARHGLTFAALAALVLSWRPLGPPIALDLAFALLVTAAALTRGPSALQRALSHPWLVHIGRVSYAIYLFHVPWIGVLSRAVPGVREQPAALFVGAFTLSVLTASLSYRYFEGPLLELSQRFRPALPVSGSPGLLGARPV